jgi:hypothetical protein
LLIFNTTARLISPRLKTGALRLNQVKLQLVEHVLLRVTQGFRDDGVRWTVYRGDRPVETFAARAVAEECARALNADLEAARPCQEIRHEPSEADAREASRLFGELEEDLNVAEFEAWLDGLQSERFRQVAQAIDVLRGALAEYRGDVDRREGAGRID